MTPAARIAAAIDVLDWVLAGQAAEPALKAWARGRRFAGSKDRAAVRDYVFDGLRARRSLGAIGGGDTGRAIMLGWVLREGIDPATVFTGEGYAPAPLSSGEPNGLSSQHSSMAASCDIPDWLWSEWSESLGSDAEVAAKTQQRRARVFLRVNLRRTNLTEAVTALAKDGITSRPHGQVKTALEVIENERRILTSQAYANGLVEIQDASSQWAVSALSLRNGQRVLDYCAGGGGKSLAIADTFNVQIDAHDVNAGRMKDIPTRAKRAGVSINRVATQSLHAWAPWDVVFCDAPCSGSGTWRRNPQSKWELDSNRLKTLHDMQNEVLGNASELVAGGGLIYYATCSVLNSENGAMIANFCAQNPEWGAEILLNLRPSEAHDGFFLARLERC